MRPIRTIAPVALGLVALAVAGCQRPSDPTTAAAPTPTRVVQVAPTPTHPATPSTSPAPDPRPETIVGLWPVKTLAQARELQDGVDAGHQPWLLSAESVAVAYARASWACSGPMWNRWGRAPIRSAPTTASGRPPCTWPSRFATPTACGS